MAVELKHAVDENRYIKISKITIYQRSEVQCKISSGILPVNASAEVNILNLNYINRFLFYPSSTRLSNDVYSN